MSGQSDASQGTSSPSNDSDVSQSDNDSPIQDEEDLEGTPFEIEVKKSLRILTRAFFGDKRSHFQGLVGRVEDVETDLYGGNNPDRGIKTRFENLENTVKSMSSSCTSATGSVSTVAAPAADVVQQLTRSNEVLAGFATRLQMENKSLRNSLYVQKDRQTYLNLHLGGVEVLPTKTPKEEAAQFFKEILELKDVKPSDFVKAYRKSNPRQFEETVKLTTGETSKLQVSAPGLMFVWLESESLRERAMVKARGLGGKRHATLNYKYFVSSVECEATRATKERYKSKIQKIVTGNKDKEDKDKTKFYFRGQELFGR